MKKKIIIISIIIISVIAIIVGICSVQSDDKKNRLDEDTPADVKVEEFEDEWIVVPSTQEESEENSKKDSKDEVAEPNVNSSTKKEVQEDPEGENDKSQTDQNQTEPGMEMGEYELPFVPIE